jgi:purine-binding chemotaxis protein CheW
VRLVDTVALMALGGPVAAPDYRQVVLLGDGRWALACHAGAAVRTVDPEQVSWRDRRGARPWLAGTLREGLHPLIGARALERWLDGTLA